MIMCTDITIVGTEEWISNKVVFQITYKKKTNYRSRNYHNIKFNLHKSQLKKLIETSKTNKEKQIHKNVLDMKQIVIWVITRLNNDINKYSIYGFLIFKQ